MPVKTESAAASASIKSWGIYSTTAGEDCLTAFSLLDVLVSYNSCIRHKNAISKWAGSDFMTSLDNAGFLRISRKCQLFCRDFPEKLTKTEARNHFCGKQKSCRKRSKAVACILFSREKKQNRLFISRSRAGYKLSKIDRMISCFPRTPK